MAARRRSIFEKLTGTVSIDDEQSYGTYRGYDDDVEQPRNKENRWELPRNQQRGSGNYEDEKNAIQDSVVKNEWLDQVDTNEGELSLDMYQTPDEIVIQAMVAGVKPDDVDISITREMVTIKGHRDAPRGIEDYDYFHKELYWGTFSRTVMLPHEVEVEECEAVETHGLLVLHLPKINKAKESKLTVKSRV